MITSMPCDGLRLGASQWAAGDKVYDTSGALSGERNRTLTAFKKISVSARRALRLVSRRIDHRGANRSGSVDDVAGASQNLGEESPRSPITTMSTQFASNSFHLHQFASLPSPLPSSDVSSESPRNLEDHLQRAQASLSPQPSQSLNSSHLQQQQQRQQRQQVPSPEAVAVPTSKPRSLLSALLKRPASATQMPVDGTASKLPGAIAASPPLQKSPLPSAHSSRPPAAGCGLRTDPSAPAPFNSSAGPPEEPPSPEPLQPNMIQACSVGRMYESLPTQQDRKMPVQHALLVPRPRRIAAVDRLDMCLSAPSPHPASQGHNILNSKCGGGSGGGGGGGSVVDGDAVHAAPAMANGPSPVDAGALRRVPEGGGMKLVGQVESVPILLIGTNEALQTLPEPSPGASVPAASLLAASFANGRGGGVAMGILGAAPPATPAQAARLTAEAVPPPPSLLAGPSILLATSCSTPPAMMRNCWSLDDYSLQKRLYKGKMSSVYKGRCLRSGLPVALKVYFKSRVPSNVVHMLMREVSIHLDASQHKSVLKLYGVFQTDDVVVLVMELASRGCLSSICDNIPGGRLSEVQVRRTVMEPLLEALSYLHGKGVCHRDIKPENLLFTSDWGLRLADFGVSINLLEERAVTRAGTADYMAPEVQRCPMKVHPDENKGNESLSYTNAVDVWSVGVLAYELLVGFPPVVSDNATTGGDRGCRRGPSAAGLSLSFPSSVSAAARDFISSALAQLPEERPTVRQLRCHPWMLVGAAETGRHRNIVI